MEEFVVRKQVLVRAPARHVWHALTDPEQTEKYFYGCRVDSNWIVGDQIVFKRRLLWIFPFELTGKIRKINRGSMVQYSLKNSKSPTESVITLELWEQNGKTTVSVADDVGQGEGVEDRYNQSVKGWDKILNGLKQTVERGLSQ